MESTETTARIRRRIDAVDWRTAEASLGDRGYARLPGLLSAVDCRQVIRLYADRERFRSTVDLAQHRFGDRGDYRYFASPLPPLIRALRVRLYSKLAPIGNRWKEALGATDRLPRSLSAFLGQCRAAGQTRPTPLVLRYDAGGYNCLHQDRYGAVGFPLQVTILLSRLHVDFEGGEFLLTEQRPRMQSRGEAIALERGEGIVFPNTERPVAGARGVYRAQLRHGVSRIHAGERFTLGIIFHDAA
ncbi:MAG: 2OG-Fe(II) oxygenase [Proteobacteria bacterium]|nr:2OG-Fe(II) oxygenase [Pseudomonadota bacterium]